MKKVLIIIMFVILGISSFSSEKTQSKKKIVMVKDDDGAFFNAVAGLFGSLIEQKGWTKDKADYIVLSMEGKKDRAKIIIKEIEKINPDVVLMNNTLIDSLTIKMNNKNIPFVSGGGLEKEDINGNMVFLNKYGYPKANLTGTFTMPRSHLSNTFALLNRITPLNGKKIVFSTMPSAAFSEKKIKEALKNLNGSLKEYKEFNYVEDYQAFVKKYNNDDEVAWIITGENIVTRKDGKKYTREEAFKWDTINNKKPNISFWELVVEKGALCALAIDSMTTVGQMMDIADRILNGENFRKIEPEDPKKTLILLNQKTAKNLGLEIPFKVISSSWRIYTDYNGNYVGKK